MEKLAAPIQKAPIPKRDKTRKNIKKKGRKRKKSEHMWPDGWAAIRIKRDSKSFTGEESRPSSWRGSLVGWYTGIRKAMTARSGEWTAAPSAALCVLRPAEHYRMWPAPGIRVVHRKSWSHWHSLETVASLENVVLFSLVRLAILKLQISKIKMSIPG